MRMGWAQPSAAEHDGQDWADYRAAMVADKRLMLRMRVDRLYGQAR